MYRFEIFPVVKEEKDHTYRYDKLSVLNQATHIAIEVKGTVITTTMRNDFAQRQYTAMRRNNVKAMRRNNIKIDKYGTDGYT